MRAGGWCIGMIPRPDRTARWPKASELGAQGSRQLLSARRLRLERIRQT